LATLRAMKRQLQSEYLSVEEEVASARLAQGAGSEAAWPGHGRQVGGMILQGSSGASRVAQQPTHELGQQSGGQPAARTSRLAARFQAMRAQPGTACSDDAEGDHLASQVVPAAPAAVPSPPPHRSVRADAPPVSGASDARDAAAPNGRRGVARLAATHGAPAAPVTQADCGVSRAGSAATGSAADNVHSDGADCSGLAAAAAATKRAERLRAEIDEARYFN
jgi:hypothetical protein